MPRINPNVNAPVTFTFSDGTQATFHYVPKSKAPAVEPDLRMAGTKRRLLLPDLTPNKRQEYEHEPAR